MTTTENSKATETATLIVKRTRILGTDCVVFSAWVPSKLAGNHSTITSNPEGGWLGRVGTEREGPREAAKAAAYAAIVAEYPEAEAGRRVMGEIELWG